MRGCSVTQALVSPIQSHMNRYLLIVRIAILPIFIVAGLNGCVMQRTVSENGHVVSQDYVVERPIRDAIREAKD